MSQRPCVFALTVAALACTLVAGVESGRAVSITLTFAEAETGGGDAVLGPLVGENFTWPRVLADPSVGMPIFAPGTTIPTGLSQHITTGPVPFSFDGSPYRPVTPSGDVTFVTFNFMTDSLTLPARPSSPDAVTLLRLPMTLSADFTAQNQVTHEITDFHLAGVGNASGRFLGSLDQPGGYQWLGATYIVPEPSAWLLMGTGVLGLQMMRIMYRTRRKRF
jgi:hypothetical protein